jgi:hypothetical protein
MHSSEVIGSITIIYDTMVTGAWGMDENGVAYLLSYTVSVEKLWTQNTRIIHDV